MVFILLIFFATASTFSQSTGSKIHLPESKTTQNLSPQHIPIGISENGTFYIQKSPISKSKLKQFLAKQTQPNQFTQIAFIADKNTPIKYLVHAMDICKQVGINNMSIAERKKTHEK